MKSVKTLLVSPPKYQLEYPTLGIPSLVGFLRSHGKEVVQRDLNHDYFRYFMNRLRVENCTQQVPEHLRYRFTSYLLNQSYIQRAEQSVYFAQALKENLDLTYFDDKSDSSYHFAENMLNADYLEDYLTDVKENSYLQFYEGASVAKQIAESGAKLLGISIIGPSQIIAALTLACHVKNAAGSDFKVVLGGQWCTLYKDDWISFRKAGKWVDFLIHGEGETPLLGLIEHIEATKRVEEISNLIYFSDGEWRSSGMRSKEVMKALPAPDFDALPLWNYGSFKTHDVALTFETSRECYWNRCTFCVDLPLPHEGYRVKPVNQVVDEMQTLTEKYGAKYLFFSDPAMSPARLKKISQEMIRRRFKVSFWCFGRMEKNFDTETFALAKAAGCDSMSFGLETANQRMMDLMDKGTTVADVSRIIRVCAEAGIEVTLQMMLRFPTETFEEGLDTIQFLVEHKHWIHEVTFNLYYLTPGNHIFNDPSRFAIEILSDQPRFRFFYRFHQTRQDAMTDEQAEELLRVYAALLHQSKTRNFAPGAQCVSEHDLFRPETPSFFLENETYQDRKSAFISLEAGAGHATANVWFSPVTLRWGLDKSVVSKAKEQHV